MSRIITGPGAIVTSTGAFVFLHVWAVADTGAVVCTFRPLLTGISLGCCVQGLLFMRPGCCCRYRSYCLFVCADVADTRAIVYTLGVLLPMQELLILYVWTAVADVGAIVLPV